MLVSFLAGLAHAGLMAVAFAPVEFGWAALVAIVPLVWVAVGMEKAGVSNGASRVSERSGGSRNSNSESGELDGSATSRLRERLYVGRCRKRDAVMVGLGASAFYWWQQQWVMDISAAGYVPLVMYLAIYPGLFVWLLSRLHGRFPRVPLAVLVPIVWTGLEWIRGEVVWDGYAWFLLGHPLIDTPIAWAGSVVGAYGVGALVAGWCGLACGIILSRGRITAIRRWGTVATLCLLLISCFAMLQGASAIFGAVFGPSLRVAIIQTNVPQSNKVGWTAEQREKDFERFLQLTQQSVPKDSDGVRRPAVVIWPETMFPGYFLEPLDVQLPDGTREKRVTRFTTRLLEMQGALRVPLLIGALGTENLRLEPGPDGGRVAFDARYNSVFRVERGEVLSARYDKVRLTPFGETMPYISAWPWLEKRLLSIGAAGMSFDLGKGSVRAEALFGFDLTTLSDVPKVPTRAKLATPICFEVTETSLCRQMVRLAAADGSLPMLVNVTNDGWFGDWKPGKQQHLLASRWRSIELGVPVVRAANTGISAAIEFGKTGVRTLEHNQDGFLVGDVEFYRFSTVYRDLGDLCWVFPLTLAGLVILAIVRKTPNNQGGGSGTETAKAA